MEAIGAIWLLALFGAGALWGRDPIGVLSGVFSFAMPLCILLLTCSRLDSPLGKLLRLSPVLMAGEISYSVYIWQLWGKLTLSGASVYAVFGLYGYITVAEKIAVFALITTLMAYGSYTLYERPMRTWLRAMLMESK